MSKIITGRRDCDEHRAQRRRSGTDPMCAPKEARREVNRARAFWMDDQTIKLLYNSLLFPGYRKTALKLDRHTCRWCGAPATTVDHIVPSSKGGWDLHVNLLASCGECNTRRGNRSAVSYLRDRTHRAPNLLKGCGQFSDTRTSILSMY